MGFKANTCESCIYYFGEYFMDGPALCALRRILIWPNNKRCDNYRLSKNVGRGYSREDERPGTDEK